jgi:AcrR family transcriptional regulator
MAPPTRYPRSGNTFRARRSKLADRLAEFVLEDGINDLGLRPAAKRLGTSDRMLLYYFGTKSELVAAVLERISERQTTLLGIGPAVRRPPRDLLLRAWAVISDPKFIPFMRVWVEVASRGTRGEAPYQALAKDAATRWLSWIESQLDLASPRDRRTYAAAILAILEGATVLEMSAPHSSRGIADLLSRAFQ